MKIRKCTFQCSESQSGNEHEIKLIESKPKNYFKLKSLNKKNAEEYKAKFLRVTLLICSINIILSLGGGSAKQLPPTVVGIESGSRAAFPLKLIHSSQYVRPRIALIG